MTKKATIKDVARLAGVSTATVSRALDGSKVVSPKLTRAVLSASEQLGYDGNSVARALRKSHTNAIGMVVPEIANPFMTDLIQEIESALSARGKQLLLCNSMQSVDRERRAITSLLHRQVDGVIICPVHETESADAIADISERLPTVLVDQRVRGTSVDWVGVDDDAAMRLIVEHLAERGAKTISFAGSTGRDSSSMHRLAALRTYIAAQGMRLDERHILLGDYSPATGRRAVEMITSTDFLPDTLVCAADIIAVGALQKCAELGIAVPGQIMVTGVDDIEFSKLCTPTLTTVAQPLAAIARRTADLLTSEEKENDTPAVRLAFTPKLIVRGSTMHPGEGLA